MQRQSLTFSGRVQRVGFRATTRSIAARHAVTGWVRNEPDGTVRCEVQGASSACEGFVAEVRERLGRYIAGVRVEDLPVDAPEEVGFVIRR